MNSVASDSERETSSRTSTTNARVKTFSRIVASQTGIRSEFESLISESSDEEEASINIEIARGQQQRSKCQDGATRNLKNRSDQPSISGGTDQIILSLIWNKNHLGAAYYNISTCQLFVMEDTMDSIDHLDVTKALYRQCQPHYVITTAASPVPFINALNKLAITETLHEQWNSFELKEHARNAVLKTVCKKEHSFERSSHRVRCLRLECEPKNASYAARVTFLNSILNFKCCTMIHALGLLLSFIDRHWNNMALDPSGKPLYISLDYIVLKELVTVDGDTYKALNIIQARDHPSLFKFGQTTTKSKGVSLFSLLSRYCQSRPGVQLLWRTLQHPTRNIAVLEQRLNAIEFFLDPKNQSVVENLSACLRHVYRLTNASFTCCSGSQAKVSDWYKLHKTVSHVISIADICEDYTERLELLRQISESVTNEMQYVKYFIEYIIDFCGSKCEGKLAVKPNVDPLLDELNHVRRTLPELLTRMGEKDMRQHLPASVTGCNMLYLPNIGYVLAINNWNPTPPEDVSFSNLEFKFSINNVHYYKSPSARELDETVGDIILKIAIRQNHILQKLIRYVRKNTGPILSAIQLCAELDTLLAFYKVARDYNYSRPKLTESKVIDVKEGRHPLLECLTTFIPNDIYSGKEKSLIKVLTGPNACGKSVYLKQIGLIVFMAHIGSYVPAKFARIGVVTHILTQMLNTESIGLNCSSFLQNLRQINVALRASTSNSIVITDELDRGTSDVSGQSLVAAVLNTFAEKGGECPHIFAATHAHSVLSLLSRTPLIEIQTFDYVVNEDESLAFLHRLTNGSTQRSFAHFIARQADLKEDTVKRSLEVYEAMKRHQLPSSNCQRSDELKRIVHRVTTMLSTDIDVQELKALIRRVIISSNNTHDKCT